MKRVLTVVLLSCFSAAIVGCSASATVDPDRVHSDSRTTTSSETSVKKTTYRDANGNLVEQKVERHENP